MESVRLPAVSKIADARHWNEGVQTDTFVTYSYLMSMQANKLLYERAQVYYNDFVFPTLDMKSYNGFVYKTYSTQPDIRYLFDDPFNQEVLDRHYAETVYEDVKVIALPSAAAAIRKLTDARKAIKKLMGTNHPENELLLQQMIAVERSQSLLELYKRNLLKPLALELQKLLNSTTLIPDVVVNSERLQHVLKLMTNTGTVLEHTTGNIGNPGTKPSRSIDQAMLMAKAREEMQRAVDMLRSFEKINADLVRIMEKWKRNRIVHEQQEILN